MLRADLHLLKKKVGSTVRWHSEFLWIFNKYFDSEQLKSGERRTSFKWSTAPGEICKRIWEGKRNPNDGYRSELGDGKEEIR